MGVKHLNKLIRTLCNRTLKKTHLSELQNKQIAVDISIYMYKFKQNGDLMDGVFNMINLFQKYNIQPLFVFDGKPPIEKQQILNERSNNKKAARIEYNKLMVEFNTLTNNNSDSNSDKELIKIEKKIDIYKRTMTKLSYKDIVDVKKLINYMGENYYESHVEADSVIAKLVKEQNIWGCMSEDMDMFVYGCPIVLRYFSLIKEEVIIYNLHEILDSLKLTHNEFKEICILSGTDYNTDYNTRNIEFNINFIMNKYIEYTNTDKKITFYEWFKEQNYIIDINKLNKISQLFNIDNIDLSKANYVKGNKSDENVEELLIKYGYIFI